MALQLIWTSSVTQVEMPAAYARVISINVDAVAMTIDLGIGLYASAEARNMPDTQPFDVFHAWPEYVDFLGTPVDVRAAAYQFLKTLAQFSSSMDV